MYARKPDFAFESARIWPSFTETGLYIGISKSSRVGDISQPVKQIVMSARNLYFPPLSVNSSPGSPAEFPRIMFAKRKLKLSIAPLGGTPISQYFNRPG